jgi:hypothetical protein
MFGFRRFNSVLGSVATEVKQDSYMGTALCCWTKLYGSRVLTVCTKGQYCPNFCQLIKLLRTRATESGKIPMHTLAGLQFFFVPPPPFSPHPPPSMTAGKGHETSDDRLCAALLLTKQGLKSPNLGHGDAPAEANPHRCGHPCPIAPALLPLPCCPCPAAPALLPLPAYSPVLATLGAAAHGLRCIVAAITARLGGHPIPRPASPVIAGSDISPPSVVDKGVCDGIRGAWPARGSLQTVCDALHSNCVDWTREDALPLVACSTHQALPRGNVCRSQPSRGRNRVRDTLLFHPRPLGRVSGLAHS